MINIINEACNIMGLANSDYVMFKKNYPEYINYNNINNTRINTVYIISDKLDEYVKKSEWSYHSLASLLSNKTVLLNGRAWLKATKSIECDDILILCWALKCKPSDICSLKIEDNNGKRILNKRQICIINNKIIANLSENDKHELSKYVIIPKYFINEMATNKTIVSIELLEDLYYYLNIICTYPIKYTDLCINYDEIKQYTLPKINTSRKSTYAQEQLDQAIKLIKENIPLSKINKITGISYNTLCRYRKMIVCKKDITINSIISNNMNRVESNNALANSDNLKDIFSKIKNLNAEDINKLEEYITTIKKIKILEENLD